MEKGEGEDLPDALIQHIQSFLSGEEAARTTILSKSWYNSWLTRPNLVFDRCDFWKFGYMKRNQEFSKFSKKTMQRYRDLNLKIDSFKFRTLNECHSLANELTVEAIKMGATDISLEIPSKFVVLPGEVLQSESLTRLSITGCKMKSLKVNCSMLKYLRLCQVSLEGDLFWDIISNCPLIEGLEVRECERRLMTQLDILKRFELHKLKTLFLEKIYICSLFFSDFSSRFPCLKDLSVHDCLDWENFQIYSQSLEFISFEGVILKANFDVPNLRKFCFSGDGFLPSVSFPNSCNWESDVYISLSHDDHISAKWLLNLNKLLRNLSSSKVSLNLKSSYCLSNIDKAGNTACLPRPLVEKLTIHLPSSDCATTLLDSLIQCCRPVFVTQDFSCYSYIHGKTSIESLKLVYKTLMQQSNSVDGLEEVSIEVFDGAVSGWRTVPSVNDLDDIGVEVFDEAVSRWRAVPRSLLGTSSYRVVQKMIRFHLRWAQH